MLRHFSEQHLKPSVLSKLSHQPTPLFTAASFLPISIFLPLLQITSHDDPEQLPDPFNDISIGGWEITDEPLGRLSVWAVSLQGRVRAYSISFLIWITIEKELNTSKARQVCDHLTLVRNYAVCACGRGSKKCFKTTLFNNLYSKWKGIVSLRVAGLWKHWTSINSCLTNLGWLVCHVLRTAQNANCGTTNKETGLLLEVH